MAVNDKIIVESPAKDLTYKAEATDSARRRPSSSSSKSLRTFAHSVLTRTLSRAGIFVEFLGLAGLGQAEAAWIKRSDVDLDAGRVIVYRHKTDIGFAIPIYPQLRPLIEKLCEGKPHNTRLFSVQRST